MSILEKICSTTYFHTFFFESFAQLKNRYYLCTVNPKSIGGKETSAKCGGFFNVRNINNRYNSRMPCVVAVMPTILLIRLTAGSKWLFFYLMSKNQYYGNETF